MSSFFCAALTIAWALTAEGLQLAGGAAMAGSHGCSRAHGPRPRIPPMRTKAWQFLSVASQNLLLCTAQCLPCWVSLLCACVRVILHWTWYRMTQEKFCITVIVDSSFWLADAIIVALGSVFMVSAFILAFCGFVDDLCSTNGAIRLAFEYSLSRRLELAVTFRHFVRRMVHWHRWRSCAKRRNCCHCLGGKDAWIPWTLPRWVWQTFKIREVCLMEWVSQSDCLECVRWGGAVGGAGKIQTQKKAWTTKCSKHSVWCLSLLWGGLTGGVLIGGLVVTSQCGSCQSMCSDDVDNFLLDVGWLFVWILNWPR